MVIDHIAYEAFEKHVLKEFPREACGVIVNSEFIACRNIALQPTQHFEIDAKELLLITATKGKIEALLHSHPVVSATKWPAEWPSGHDMQQWMKGEIPWGIVATEGENLSTMVWMDESTIAPLEGRTFTHGVHDCYAMIRDWYRVTKGITLKNYARGMDWWDKGENLYEQNFADAGFKEIPRSELDIGDVVLLQVRANVPNHAAVITGSNTMMHHLYDRYSGPDSFNRWERFIVRCLRYSPVNSSETETNQ